MNSNFKIEECTLKEVVSYPGKGNDIEFGAIVDFVIIDQSERKYHIQCQYHPNRLYSYYDKSICGTGESTDESLYDYFTEVYETDKLDETEKEEIADEDNISSWFVENELEALKDFYAREIEDYLGYWCFDINDDCRDDRNELLGLDECTGFFDDVHKLLYTEDAISYEDVKFTIGMHPGQKDRYFIKSKNFTKVVSDGLYICDAVKVSIDAIELNTSDYQALKERIDNMLEECITSKNVYQEYEN
jgi:hypothetical protein